MSGRSKSVPVAASQHPKVDVAVLLSTVTAFLLYWNTLDADFAYDDSRAVKTNQDLLPSAPLAGLFANDFWGTPLTHSGSHKSYRPLCVLSFRLNYYLGELEPFGYHLGNIALHALVSGLFTHLARVFLRHTFPTLVAGMLFAAHPIHTEAVAGVVGRADLGAALFFLVALLCYVKYCKYRDKAGMDEARDRRRWIMLGATLVSATCSMLTKEHGITVLAVCAVYDVLIHTKMRLRHAVAVVFEKKYRGLLEGLAALSGSVALLISLRVHLMGSRPPDFAPADNPAADSDRLLTRTLTFLYLPTYNFWLMLCPRWLSFDWSMEAIPLITSPLDFRNVYTALFFAAFARLAFHAVDSVNHGRRRRWRQHQTKVSATFNNSSLSARQNGYAPLGGVGGGVVTNGYVSVNHNYKCSAYCAPPYNGGYGKNKKSGASAPASRVAAATSNGYHNGYANGNSCALPPFAALQAVAATLCSTSSLSSGSSSSAASSCASSSCSSSSSNDSGYCHASNGGSDTSAAVSNGSNHNFYHQQQQQQQQQHRARARSPPTAPAPPAASSVNHADTLVLALTVLVLPFVPASNLFFYVGFVVAERVLYIPSMGFCLLVALGAQLLHRNVLQTEAKRRTLMLVVGLLLVMFCIRTVRRNRDWLTEENLYRSGIPVNPPKAFGNLANILSAQGKKEEAEWAYKKALSYRSNMADVHYNLGILLQEQKRHEEALHSYRLAIQFRPRMAMAHLNLGLVLGILNRKEEAAEVYRHCSQLDGTGLKDPKTHESTKISALFNLGRLYADDARYEEAIVVYKEAVRKMPGHYQPQSLYNMLGEAYFKLERYDEAEYWYKEALRVKPDHIPAHLTYGKMLAKLQNRLNEAEQWFTRAKLLAPNDSSVYQHYGQFLSETERHAEAAVHYVKAAELAPDEYEIIFNAANTLRQAGQNEEAEKYYRMAVKLRPNEATSHMNLGAMLHVNGKLIEAEMSYLEALRLKPDDNITQNNLQKLRNLLNKRGIRTTHVPESRR